jgi:YVTN family beta-propeller protein
MRYSIHSFLFILLLFCSCSDNDTPTIKASGAYDEGVWIANEGNFMSSDGSISFFHTDSSKVENNVFYNVNKRHLGDVVQSITIAGERAYVVVNNSKKIEVINALTGVSVGVITGVASPRYLVVLGEKAYVTDLYADKVYVVNTQTLQIIKEIKVSGWTEKMAVVGGKIYVASRRTNADMRTGGNLILAINPSTDTVTDSIFVGKASGELIADASGFLWTITRNPALVRIAATPLHIHKVFSLPNKDTTLSVLAKNGLGDTLFWLQKEGVCKMATNTSSTDYKVVVPKKSYNFYGLGVSPHNSDIYVSDAIDFTQKGVVFRHKRGGTRIDSFRVGLIPSNFTFTE